MTGSTIIFYLLALLTLVSAVLAVTSRQIFRAAIYLLFTLIGIAGFYFWMQYDFIAAVQIIVYVGGITVLIIFSIFLTQQAGELLPKQKIGRQVFAAAAVFCSFALVMLQMINHHFTVTADQSTTPTIAAIGEKMLATTEDGYALPFEVVSILLLAAMIGCIVIAMRPEDTLPNEQDLQQK
ncbi:MAG TPA: NADH-quinone oxidoreductase subunit J [Ferruginibacter sp.]|jgi:NADH-quinone oxidoreductase subunit J|nr:NADH-quinone oxidoreductase subunit J [Ferruginibacter sp.]HPH89247.1 NADH-quinone oxidoreductase subunit J [Ferruginibacter sp.]